MTTKKKLLQFAMGLLLVLALLLGTGAYRNIPILFIQKLAYSDFTCHPFYSDCLNLFSFDYDCEGGEGNGPQYIGKVRVAGYDIFGLDRDDDGWGCELNE